MVGRRRTPVTAGSRNGRDTIVTTRRALQRYRDELRRMTPEEFLEEAELIRDLQRDGGPAPAIVAMCREALAEGEERIARDRRELAALGPLVA